MPIARMVELVNQDLQTEDIAVCALLDLKDTIAEMVGYHCLLLWSLFIHPIDSVFSVLILLLKSSEPMLNCFF